MSAIFGIRKARQRLATEVDLVHFGNASQKFGRDGLYIRAGGRVGMGFQPYHTHERSVLEDQPAIDEYGNMLTLDGRLDNYSELCTQLGLSGNRILDSSIVLKAFARWGENCFSRLVGDWALALWSDQDQLLYLARDHAGTRTLYFEQTDGDVHWSTYLDTFFVAKKSRDLDEDFAASYLACRPTRDLTPYKGIEAVTPAHYLVFNDNKMDRKIHWQWIVKDRIHYRTDAEYGEHFLTLFKSSVARRTGPGAPILAQLSGGMDSTSIVCVSDHLRIGQGAKLPDLLDTVSYFDDTEPNWNERPYFSLVEASRGKTGVHIDSSRTSFCDLTINPPSLQPRGALRCPEKDIQFDALIESGGYRAILSGLGGDELLGGVPTGIPELADYLVSAQLNKLICMAVSWCLTDRKPLVNALAETIAYTALLYRPNRVNLKLCLPWLRACVTSRCKELARRDVTVGNSLGLAPSSVNNALTWWSVLGRLPHTRHVSPHRSEYRYPFLDKELVDFLLRVPRNQLVRPGRRRFLMREALKGIVPIDILERRRKASRIRGPLTAFRDNQEKLMRFANTRQFMVSRFLDVDEFRKALVSTTKGDNPQWWMALLRAIELEVWLRSNDAVRV
jgi:asparagine synthase (glutamine-hydrolysing)